MSTGAGDGVRQRILVVEDDRSISLGLRMNLEGEGFAVEVAEDGESGLEMARAKGWDLIILDVMLPRMNGFEVMRQLRQEGNDVRVLMLSARGAEVDKVTGLEMGADDYITKPFGLAELMARVRAALRRHGTVSKERWIFGDVTVDFATRQVHRGGVLVELTATEFDVLVALLRAVGRVLNRQEIFRAVWGTGHHGNPRTVDNFIAQLRAKLEADPSSPQHLLTVRGVGYRLVR